MAKDKAYGGVVFNSEGNVLLRKPTDHFGGYAWTFAKGRLDPGETSEDVALREVEEETGVKAEITGEVPGEFEGDTTITQFFVMELVSEGKFGWETEQIRWASLEEARRLIAETPNVKGRDRDLAILEAAVQANVERG